MNIIVYVIYLCRMLVDPDTSLLSCVTKSSDNLKPLMTMQSFGEKMRLRIRRKVDKFKDIEAYVRADIERKKSKMFRQQRHFTKVVLNPLPICCLL